MATVQVKIYNETTNRFDPLGDINYYEFLQVPDIGNNIAIKKFVYKVVDVIYSSDDNQVEVWAKHYSNSTDINARSLQDFE